MHDISFRILCKEGRREGKNNSSFLANKLKLKKPRREVSLSGSAEIKFARRVKKFILWSHILVPFLALLINDSRGFDQVNKPFFSEFRFPLKVYERLPIEGRAIDILSFNNNEIIWLTQTGKITAYDLKNKKIIWTFDSVSRDLIRLYSYNSFLLALSLQNYLLAFSREGKLLWPESFKFFGDRLVFFEGMVILSSLNHSLKAIEPSTGKMIWSKDLGENIIALLATPQKGIIVFGASGQIYQLQGDGQISPLGQITGQILPYVASAGNCLFLGTQEKNLICYSIQKRKKLWSAKLAGQLVTEPLPLGRHLLVAASNAVLYNLSQKNGEIRWWRSLPSRLAFPLLATGSTLIVATPNPPLLAFDFNSGQKVGEFHFDGEICCAPQLLLDKLILAIYDPLNEEGSLLLLEPHIEVTLSASQPSPQKVGTEIVFVAEAIGFDEPRFEFFLQTGGKREIVQADTSRNSWVWLPLAPGDYLIGVKVKDKKKSQEKTISFKIINE